MAERISSSQARATLVEGDARTTIAMPAPRASAATNRYDFMNDPGRLPRHTIELIAGGQRFAETARAVPRGRPAWVDEGRGPLEGPAIAPLNGDLAAGRRDAVDMRLGRSGGRRDIVEGDIVDGPLPAAGAVVGKAKANITLPSRLGQANSLDLPRQRGVVSIDDIRRQRGRDWHLEHVAELLPQRPGADEIA